MSDQVGLWNALASRLGIKVSAPATVHVGDVSIVFTGLLPQFGGKSGMIVDPDWEAISPHTDALLKLGYGFSAVELDSAGDDERFKEMLRDWGWSAPEPRPRWMSVADSKGEVWGAQLHVRPLLGKGGALKGAKGAHAWVFALANSDSEYREKVSAEMEGLGLFIAEVEHLGRYDAAKDSNDPSSLCISDLTDESPVQYHHFHTYRDED